MSADCAVVGIGPAGLAASLALDREGLRVLAIGPTLPDAAARDLRTTAVFSGGINLLRRLGVWDGLERSASPLVALRLIDDTGGILRAPEVLFQAGEIGFPAFGYNIDNASLLRALYDRALATPNVDLVHDEVVAIAAHPTRVALELRRQARADVCVVVGADGRKSLTRASAGISLREWTYPQTAIVTKFHHSRPHGGTSNELHRRPGPLTTVPLEGNSSSLVWVEEPAEASRLLGLSADRFGRELEQRLHGLLGTISSIGSRAAFPLTGSSAEHLTGHRTALVGEAAHVLPPIGAQGLNLGLRDAATLAETLGDTHAAGEDPGDKKCLDTYERRRRADVATRTLAVDLLNRSLLSDLLPPHLLRGAGLHMLEAVPWLRQLVMREGLEPSFNVPRLMRDATVTPPSATA